MGKLERRYARAMLRRRDGDHCCWCGRLMAFRKRRSMGMGMGSEPDNWATIEHVTPVSQGGSDEPSNLKLACKRCNSSRASWPSDKSEAA